MSKIMLIEFDQDEDPFEDIGEESGLAEQKHLMILDGEVKIHHGLTGYIMETLKDAPPEMEFILIERHRRMPKAVEKASVTPTGKIHITYTDGTEETIEDAHTENEDPSS